MPKLPKPRTIDVEIYDQKYSIVLKADIQEAEIRRVADDVDERMPPIDDPFRTADAQIAAISSDVKVIFVDMHAEATSEKVAMRSLTFPSAPFRILPLL